jgi:hypothetical protein
LIIEGFFSPGSPFCDAWAESLSLPSGLAAFLLLRPNISSVEI